MSENKSDLFNTVKDKTSKVDASSDISMVNPTSEAAISIRDNGDINISSGDYVQYKIDKNNSSIIENSLSNVTNTVIKEINATDMNINKHKFNNQLIDLTDFRNVNGNIIGGMMFNGTVLVKTWEPTLERWVLIRRPISTAMFSNRLNIPSSPEQFELDLNVLEDIREYYAKQDE